MSGLASCPICGRQQPVTAPYCIQCGNPMPGLGTGNLPQNTTLQGGRYVILQTVGRGGMGAVYKAADTRLGRKTVAIKEMSDVAITTPQQKLQAVTAFRQEAQMLARLDHPNIPKVTDSFDGANNLRPAWSPDSRQIAFTSDRDGTTAIWVVPVDLSQTPRRISAGEGFDAAWSRP